MKYKTRKKQKREGDKIIQKRQRDLTTNFYLPSLLNPPNLQNYDKRYFLIIGEIWMGVYIKHFQAIQEKKYKIENAKIKIGKNILKKNLQ